MINGFSSFFMISTSENGFKNKNKTLKQNRILTVTKLFLTRTHFKQSKSSQDFGDLLKMGLGYKPSLHLALGNIFQCPSFFQRFSPQLSHLVKEVQ